MINALTLFSGVSFLFFGIGYLFWPPLRREFGRYGLKRIRVPLAVLQVVGGAGQLLSLVYPPLAMPAALGLGAMMAIAIGVRVWIGDSLVQMLPAVAYLLANAYLIWAAVAR